MATKQRKQLAPADILDRVPPHNAAAEKSVIGCVFLKPDEWDEVSSLLTADDFYLDNHQRIFRATAECRETGRPIDLQILTERLKAKGEFELIGGAYELALMFQQEATARHAAHYAQIVRDHSIRRQMIYASSEISRDAYDCTIEPANTLAAAENHFLGIRDRGLSGTERVTPAPELAQNTIAEVNRRMNREYRGGLQTGFEELDGMISLRPSELIVLGARTSVGKTALAANIALNISIDQGRSVLFVSLEMGTSEIGMRFIGSLARVDSKRIEAGSLTEDERASVIEAGARLAEANLEIDDSPLRTVADIASVARRMRRRRGLELIVVDYLQYVTTDDSKLQRHEQVARISGRLKTLAREMRVPILCLSQLGRDADAKEKPKLRHLRESGAIEQDADIVMLLHRPDAEDRTNQADVSRAHLYIEKQRNGPTGVVELDWHRRFTRFESVHYDPFTEPPQKELFK